VAWYDAGSVVVSPLRGFCVRTQPADMCAVSNVEEYGYPISEQYVKIACVLTYLSGRRCWRGAVVCGTVLSAEEYSGIRITYKISVSRGQNIQLG
jgi:hypothetical protein